MEIKDRIIALLIDSDNISSDYFSIILDELSQYGKVTYRRLYGDFTNRKANGWKQALLDYSIEQIQQVAFTKGKNATDSKMIIDAMDILYQGKVDCFCLATSDSPNGPFTKLTREQGGWMLYADPSCSWMSGTGHNSIVEKDGVKGVYVKNKKDRYDFVPVNILLAGETTSVVSDSFYYDSEGERTVTVNPHDDVLKDPENKD